MAGNGRDSNKITAPQQRAIAALLSTKSIADAADQAKVGERTLHRWLTELPFKSALTNAEGELLLVATRRLLGLQDTALGVVEDILNDPIAKATIKFRAAVAVFEFTLKMRELYTFEQRLVALEEAYAKQLS